MKAVLLAGGRGTRLYPYTVALPKPLVPVGDLPIIEIVLRQLKHYGVTEVIVSIGHLGEIISAFLGDGRKFGLRVSYLRESSPRGTAGPLRLMKDELPDNFLLMNGDILTDLDYGAFFRDHERNAAEVTIAAYQKEVAIDLGVLKCGADDFLREYIEKPIETFRVSMGVYGIRKTAVDLIPENQAFDFPSLIQAMLAAKRPVRAWPFQGRWLDIGRPPDYEQAQAVFESAKDRFLPA